MTRTRDLEEDHVDPELYKRLIDLARRNGVDLDRLKKGQPDYSDPAVALASMPDEIQQLLGDVADEEDEAAGQAAAPAADAGDDLPEYTREADRINAGQARRPPGKPRKNQDPVNWDAIEHLLVFGETYEFNGRTLIRFPTHLDLAKRFNVDRSAVSRRARELKADERRASVQQRITTEVETIIVAEHAAAIVHGREQMIGICQDLISQFKEQVRLKKIRVDSVADFNTLIRLHEFLTGAPDQRGELSHVIKLEDLQERHRQAMAARSVWPTQDQPTLGVVDERIVHRAGGVFDILPKEGSGDPVAAIGGLDAPRQGQGPKNAAQTPPRSGDGVLRLTHEEEEVAEADQAVEDGYITTHAVTSSQLAELGYSDERGLMEVVFHSGDVWRYKVPRDVYEAIDHAGSPGREFDARIKKAGVQGKKVA